MRLVTQRKFGGCGLACVAMVTGASLDAVEQAALDLGIVYAQCGIADHELINLLEIFRKRGVTKLLYRTTWEPCILMVPSLNIPGLLHYIVWDGKQYLDPSPGPLRYPDNAPVIEKVRVPPQAGYVIVWDREELCEDRHAAITLDLLQRVYRKFQLEDARVTEEDTLDRVRDWISDTMGPTAAEHWADDMQREIEAGNHD